MQSADNSGNPFNEVVGKLQPTKFNGATIKLDPKAIVSVSAATLGDGGVAEYFKNNPGKTIDSVNFATAGALFFLGTSMIDSKAIAAGIQELSGSLPGGEELKANATGAEGMLGFSLADDLVPAIGNEFAIVVNKVDLDSGPFPSVDAGIIIKVGDKAKMEKIISSLEKLGANALQGQELQKAKIAGADVKFVPVPVPFVQPGFTVHDGYLIIGTTKSGITALLETKGGKESLVRSDAFKKLAPRVSANGQTLSYINLGAIAQIALKAAKDRVGEDKDAQAIVRRISDVAKTLGALGGIQKVKDGLLYSENVLNLN
jgi:hypothetical protein